MGKLRTTRPVRRVRERPVVSRADKSENAVYDIIAGTISLRLGIRAIRQLCSQEDG